jgi:hypothetical protein
LDTTVAPNLGVEGTILASTDAVLGDFSLRNFGLPSPIIPDTVGMTSMTVDGTSKKFFIDSDTFKSFMTTDETASAYAFLSKGIVKSTQSICLSSGKCLNCGFHSDGSYFKSYTTDPVFMHKVLRDINCFIYEN